MKRRRQLAVLASGCALAAGCLVAVSVSGRYGSNLTSALEASAFVSSIAAGRGDWAGTVPYDEGWAVRAERSSAGVGWESAKTGWANSDGGSPDSTLDSSGRRRPSQVDSRIDSSSGYTAKGLGKSRGERLGLDGEWMGLPSNKAYYADGWNAGTPDKYWYSSCSHANGCSGENRPQNAAWRTDEYDDGWDRHGEPIPSNLDWMRYGHAPYTGSVLNKHGEMWESYPYGDLNAYMDSSTGPLNEADLDAEIRNGAGRNGGWANREQDRDGGWYDGKKEKSALDAQGQSKNKNKNSRYSYFWRTDNVMGYPEKDLPIRSTYEYDVTTGGQPYDRFWGGEDAISKDVRGVRDFFRDGAPDTNIQDRDEKDKMEKWFAGGDQVAEDKGYKSLWRDDLQLGGDMAGLVDGGRAAMVYTGGAAYLMYTVGATGDEDTFDLKYISDIYGDGGLVYVYRRSYDDEDAYDLKPWQQKGELTAVKDGSKGMGSYPWPLYNYGVDNTEYDVRHTQNEWRGHTVETYDPLDQTTDAEY